MKKNQLRLLDILQEIEGYAILLLDIQGNIETWNKGAEKIKGYTSSEIIGKNFDIFYTQEDKASGLPNRLLKQAVSNGSAYHEGWRVRKDLSRFWGSVTITAIHDDKHNLTSFVKITRDLSEKRIIETREKQHAQELEAKNKELEQFVYIASHDLQEPLLTITNFIELLEVEYKHCLDDTAHLYIDFISQGAERMKSLIKGLLGYSRIGKEKAQTLVDCHEIINIVREDLAAQIKSCGAKIYDHDLPAINAYPLELRQLFQNLISNAIKFRHKDKAPKIIITAKKTSDVWQFAVMDNGIGIDPIFNDKIFMIFQRLHTRDIYEGNGIGLAYCKKIIDLHGGHISVEPNPSGGSIFYFTIPINLS